MPSSWRQTSWLFTRRGGVECGTTKNEAIQWQEEGFEPWTSGLQYAPYKQMLFLTRAFHCDI